MPVSDPSVLGPVVAPVDLDPQAKEHRRRLANISGITAQEFLDHNNILDGEGNPISPIPNPHTQYMLWQNVWVQKEYNPHETVRDGEWTMVANKTTTDRPAPQPTAAPEWLSELSDAPAWTDDSDSAGVVITGQRYLFEAGFLTGMRVWIPVADGNQEYEVWLIEGPTGPAPIFTQLAARFAAQAVGWQEVNIPVS
ncbi:unnamed protein product, partial [marine sediment metagenome]